MTNIVFVGSRQNPCSSSATFSSKLQPFSDSENMDVLVRGYVRELTDNSNLSLNVIVAIIVRYRAAKLNEYSTDCILFGVGDNDTGRMGDGHCRSIEYLTPIHIHKNFKRIFIGPAAVFTIDASNIVNVTGELQRCEPDEYLIDDDSDSDIFAHDDIMERANSLSIDLFASKQIDLISEGLYNDHCFFYDSKSRQLWANGPNESGQLGNGTYSHWKCGKLDLIPMPWDSTKIQLIDIQCRITT